MGKAHPTDAEVLRDAADRARRLLDALTADAAALASDPAWHDGEAVYARAAGATRRLLSELEAEAAGTAKTNPPESETAPA